MAEKQTKKDDAEESAKSHGLPLNSNKREGNDVVALTGAGTPSVLVQANVGCHGLAAGEEAQLLRTEEVRLNILNGKLELLETIPAN